MSADVGATGEFSAEQCHGQIVFESHACGYLVRTDGRGSPEAVSREEMVQVWTDQSGKPQAPDRHRCQSWE